MTQPRLSTADKLERCVPVLDELAHAARLGTRNARHFDELEERAQQLAADIIAAFRRPSAGRSDPPLSIEIRADGSARAGW